MAHWGWFWKIKNKHQARTLCSKLLSIDSFQLFKNSDFSQFKVEPIAINAELHNRGFRYFFQCPLCKCRMRMLYLTDKSIFLCRQCLNLSYESQLLRPTRRYSHMNKKITKIVESQCGDTSWNKPKNMHTTTYERLRSLQHYYKQKAHQAMNTELRMWYGDKIEPHLDRYFDYAPPRP